MAEPSTAIAELVDRALVAYDDLVEVAESVEDEWQYVADLSGAWRARLREVAAARGASGGTAGEEVVVAIDTAAAEIALISDPHRAIDWLSTYPQVVLLALGEPP